MYIDFHSHILPGADHGSDSIEKSLLQLENARRAGVSTIVATPHYYMEDNTVDEFLKRREGAYNELCRHDLGGIQIIKGAEVKLSTNIEKLEGLEKLCIEGTDYILLEFPPEPWPYWIYDAVTEIARERHLRPIFAHIDRYSRMAREKMLKLNMEVQINADAFLDTRKQRRYYIDLIADDAIHLLGSDTHGDGKTSYKNFSVAIKKIGRFTPDIMRNAERIIKKSQKSK